MLLFLLFLKEKKLGNTIVLDPNLLVFDIEMNRMFNMGILSLGIIEVHAK